MIEKTNFPEIAISPQFPRILLEKYPELSLTELKVCLLLAKNMKSKTIARITGRSIRTIEYTRNNIRKKLHLKPNEILAIRLITEANDPIR